MVTEVRRTNENIKYEASFLNYTCLCAISALSKCLETEALLFVWYPRVVDSLNFTCIYSCLCIGCLCFSGCDVFGKTFDQKMISMVIISGVVR